MRSTINTLTGMQRPFVERYLVHFNATRAAKEVGYSSPDKAGPRNLQVPKIAEAIENALTDLVMDRNETLRILSSQARAEYTDYFKVGDGEPQPGRIYLAEFIYFDLEQMIADGRQHLIKEIGQSQHGPYIRFVDQQAAVIWVGKHYKLFTSIIQSERNAELDEALDALNERSAIEL